MTIIVSFDPGISTGYCRLEFTTFYGSVAHLMLTTFKRGEKILIDNYENIDKVLIEKPPVVSQYGSVTHMTFEMLLKEYSYFSIEEIFPGQWKPIAKARKWKCRSARTQHESDAFMLIRWYVFKTYKVDIGDL